MNLLLSYISQELLWHYQHRLSLVDRTLGLDAAARTSVGVQPWHVHLYGRLHPFWCLRLYKQFALWNLCVLHCPNIQEQWLPTVARSTAHQRNSTSLNLMKQQRTVESRHGRPGTVSAFVTPQHQHLDVLSHWWHCCTLDPHTSLQAQLIHEASMQT